MSDAGGVEGSRSPTLAELLRSVMDARDLETHTSLPCRVEKIDKEAQTVDVKPLLRRRFQNPDGTEINESIPVIPRVPIAWQRAGKFFIRLPIKQGDIVEVVFTEASRDAFQASSGDETDPDDFRRFDLSDAWATPGAGYPDSQVLRDFDPDDLVIGVEGGCVSHFKPGEIDLGSKNAADFVALAQKVLDELDAAKANAQAALDYAVSVSGVFASGVPVPNDGGAAVQTAQIAAAGAISVPTLATPASVAATKVKAD